MAILVDKPSYLIEHTDSGIYFVKLRGNFTTDTIQQYRGPGVELYGTTGTIQLLGDDWDPEGYEVWQNEAA